MTEPSEKIEPNYLWGEYLLKSINQTRVTREPLIEGILYKKSAQMKFAPEGIGKSLISLQEAVQGTITGNKVFGEFNVPKAFNTLYLQMERPEDENLERLKTMIAHTPFDPNHFVLDASFQEFNFKNENHIKYAIERAKRIVSKTFGTVDLVKLDPIYTMIPGGLRDDEGAAYIIYFSKILQRIFGCSVDMIHHTNRGVKDKDTGERHGKDMYGSGSFAWHCTGIYSMSKTQEGTVLKLEKSSQSNLEKKIDLVFDAESQLSFVRGASGKLSKTELLMNYLRACKVQDKYFSFADMEQVSGLSTSFLRGLCGGHLKNELAFFSKTSTGAILYKYIG